MGRRYTNHLGFAPNHEVVIHQNLQVQPNNNLAKHAQGTSASIQIIFSQQVVIEIAFTISPKFRSPQYSKKNTRKKINSSSLQFLNQFFYMLVEVAHESRCHLHTLRHVLAIDYQLEYKVQNFLLISNFPDTFRADEEILLLSSVSSFFISPEPQPVSTLSVDDAEMCFITTLFW